MQKIYMTILALLMVFTPYLKGMSYGTNNPDTLVIEHHGRSDREPHQRYHHRHKKKKSEEGYVRDELYKYRYHISILTALSTLIGALYKFAHWWRCEHAA